MNQRSAQIFLLALLIIKQLSGQIYNGGENLNYLVSHKTKTITIFSYRNNASDSLVLPSYLSSRTTISKLSKTLVLKTIVFDPVNPLDIFQQNEAVYNGKLQLIKETVSSNGYREVTLFSFDNHDHLFQKVYLWKDNFISGWDTTRYFYNTKGNLVSTQKQSSPGKSERDSLIYDEKYLISKVHIAEVDTSLPIQFEQEFETKYYYENDLLISTFQTYYNSSTIKIDSLFYDNTSKMIKRKSLKYEDYPNKYQPTVFNYD